MTVAIVHDYLTQRGGAERVVLALLRAFPDAPIYTTLFDPASTYPEFRSADVHTAAINSFGLLRRRHRLALPLLAPTVSGMTIDADVVVCSSSGWAHGVRTSGRKLVYCHTPARWLYQPRVYARTPTQRLALALVRRPLLRWDRRAAASADRYLATSTVVRDRIARVYGIEAELVPPPFGIDPAGPRTPIRSIEPGFLICVSRLLPYKNIDVVVDAVRSLPDERLVVVGDGPLLDELVASGPPNVRFVGSVNDAELRWLYSSCAAAVSASYEDFGLVPLEAAAFGRPTAALRFGGFLDTIDEGRTGIFFDRAEGGHAADAIRALRAMPWDSELLRAHASRFSEAAFVRRLQRIVADLS